MAISKEQKTKRIDELSDKLSKVKTVVMTDYRGIPTKELLKLKRELEQAGIDYEVAKKTLLKIALKKSNILIPLDDIDAPLALAFSYQDEVLVAKIIQKFIKDHENMKLVGGILDNNFVAVDVIKTLAALPTTHELLTKLVWVINSPMQKLLQTINNPIQKLILVLGQIKK